MKGKHHVIVKNRSLHYEFDIKRNITIIQGDSASGKTTLITMIRQAANLGAGSGVEVVCDVACMPLEGPGWKLLLQHSHNTIFFSDEDSSFITSAEFARALQGSDNYVVLITRENLYHLPYSVEEIYGIHSSEKYQTTKRTYQTLYRLYPASTRLSSPFRRDVPPRSDQCPKPHSDLLLTEDSNAGFSFFDGVCREYGIPCESANGKSSIFRKLKLIGDKKVFVIADGAAIGPEMDRLAKLAHENPSLTLFLPESFEWLILKSGIIDGNRIKDILESPEDNADSREYMSWEQYFTRLLVEETAGTWLQYSKSKLNPAYLQGRVKQAILDLIGR